MSQSVVWQIVKNNNCFLHKRNGIELSSSPVNVASKNAYKFSGLSRSKAVSVSLNKEGKVVLMKKRSEKRANRNKIAARWSKIVLPSDKAAAIRAIKAETQGEFPVAYRPDLTELAIEKYIKLSKIAASQNKDQ